MSRSISHLLCYIKCLHLEAADVANSASQSQLLLFHCKVCSLLVCLNFILVQKKWDNTSKGWEEVGELEETLSFDIFCKIWLVRQIWLFCQIWFFVKIDIFLKFDISIKNSWFFDQKHIVVKLIFLSTIDKNIKNHPFCSSKV